nr:DUF3375 domain-containing protein [Gordonia hirsuta]
MAALGDVYRLAGLRTDDAAWRLLRTDHAPVILGLLGRHFTHGARPLPAPELFALLDADLEELRDNGWDLPQTGRGYCAAWVRDGFLLRRSSSTAREEFLEPTEGTLAALDFAGALQAPIRAVTESRLTTLASQLSALARDSDPSAQSRLARLQVERAALDRQIAAVESGDFPVLGGERALERGREILALASEVPSDFARVQSAFDELNRSLRARILDDESDRGDTLGDVFRGVDLIADSEAGRSFSAFYDTILDPARAAQIDDAITAVLDRPFAAEFTGEQHRRLRGLLTDMEVAAGEVHAVMTSLSRSLRHFVQSRAYEEHRRIQQLIRSTQQQARTVATVRRPFDVLDLELVRVGMAIESVSALRLHDPADDRVTDEVVVHPAGHADLESLRQLIRESEIDFDELTGNIAATLTQRGQASIADVLVEHPATQGLASIVGLLVLAGRHGHRVDGTERIGWTSQAGLTRSVVIHRHQFDPTAPELQP